MGQTVGVQVVMPPGAHEYAIAPEHEAPDGAVPHPDTPIDTQLPGQVLVLSAPALAPHILLQLFCALTCAMQNSISVANKNLIFVFIFFIKLNNINYGSNLQQLICHTRKNAKTWCALNLALALLLFAPELNEINYCFLFLF